MSRHATPQPTGSPVRYGSRYGSEPAAGAEPQCLVCLTSLPSRRARYCSVACKQRAYRRRQIDVTATDAEDRKSTRLNSSHLVISYAVFCLKKKNNNDNNEYDPNQLHHTALLAPDNHRVIQ